MRKGTDSGLCSLSHIYYCMLYVPYFVHYYLSSFKHIHQSVYQTLSQSHLLCKSQNFYECFRSLFYDCGTMKVFESLFYVVEQRSKNTNKPIKFSSEYKSTRSHVTYYIHELLLLLLFLLMAM